MGNDFEARKRSKRRGKSDVDAELASEGKFRNKKRSAIRSICKGMCYNHPELTEEDKQWREDDSDEETHRDRKLAQAAITEQNRAVEAEKEKAEALRLKRQKVKERQRPKLSTEVQLLDPAQRPSKRQKTDSQATVPLSELMLSFPEAMQEFMKEAGLSEPTPIQSKAWPEILKGRDVAATAEPGSGKTLAYLLPALHLLRRLQGPDAETSDDNLACPPSILILVPTRELAQQVASVAATAKRSGIHTACIHGGTEKAGQEDALSEKPQIIVATPGRLLDLIDDNLIFLGAVRYVVLDEADKMLGMGLKPQLTQLRKLLLPSSKAKKSLMLVSKPRPQVLMMTATWSDELQESAQKWQSEPVRIHVGSSSASISQTVTQVVQVCAEHKKPQKLLKHLQQIKERSKGLRNPPRVLIFANRVKTVRFLFQTLSTDFRVVMLHGERSQSEREEAMTAFRSGKAQLMVATDVAARGLHIKGLPYIVNYDFPTSLDQYIHRAGRTGRLALQGHCFSFFTRNLALIARPLIDLLQDHNQAIDPNLEKLAEAYKIAAKKISSTSGAGTATEASPNLDANGDDLDMLAELFRPSIEAEETDEQPESRPGIPVSSTGAVVDEGSKPSASPGRKKALPGRIRKKLKQKV